MQQQGPLSDHDIFRDITEYLSITIQDQHLWRLYVQEADGNKSLGFDRFMIATSQFLNDMHPDEQRVIKMYLFPQGFITLNDLGVHLRIPLSEQIVAESSVVKPPPVMELRPIDSKDPSVPQQRQQRTDLEEEIEKLFFTVDTNQNGWLDQKELHEALVSVGINPSPDDLTAYFKQFDKNSDEKISVLEFELVFKDMLMKEMLHAEELIEDVRYEFKLICNPNSREMNARQVMQIMQRFGIHLSLDEVQSMFSEIDQDRSGQVDLDEFLAFLKRDFSSLSKNAQDILMKVRGSRNLSLQDLKVMYQNLPVHFFGSFMRKQNKGLQNLPSCFLKPKVDASGLIYDDLKMIEAQKYNLKQPLLNTRNYKPAIWLEIRLMMSDGIPIPDDTLIPWEKFLIREVGVGVFDKISKEYRGNIIYVPVRWDSRSPDVQRVIAIHRWIFKPEYPLFLSYTDYDEQADSQLELVIEMIAHLEQNGYLNAISICFGSILFSNLRVGERQTIILQGGSPTNTLNIDPKDIRTGGGFFTMKKKTARLEFQFLRITDKPTIADLATMPRRTLIPKQWLPMVRMFREYFAYLSIKDGEFDSKLASNLRIKSFMSALDTPYLADQLAVWWDQYYEKRKVPFEQQIVAFNALCEGLYVMLQRQDFKFRLGDPTKKVDHLVEVREKRQLCIAEFIQDLALAVGLGKGGNTYFEMEPMNINELMDLDDEDEIKSFQKLMSRAKK